jgi:hypothetical protein
MIIALRQNRWSSLPAATRILGWILSPGKGKKNFIVKHHHPSSHRVARVSVFGVSVFLFFSTIVERCSLFNSIMCVCVYVYVCVCIPSLPFMGLFFVLYTSIIHYTQCLWSKYNCVQKRRRKCVWFAGLQPQQL